MKTKTQIMNRILSLVLSIMMVVSMLPTNVFTASAEAEESNRVIYCDIGPWTSLTGLELKYSSDNSTINEIVMEKVSDNIWKADLTTNDLTGQTIQFVGENVMSVGTVVPADKNCFRITEYNDTTVGYEGVWYQYPCASHDYKDGICACGVACTHTGGTATCTTPAVCESCGASYGAVDKTKHDSSVECVNGFCPYCDAYEPAELVDGVYQISNAGQLYWFAAKVNSGNVDIDGKLMKDIQVNQNVLKTDGTLNGDGSNFRTWTPIGNSSYSYKGTFDGAGFTVSGLYFNNTDAYFVGLFGNAKTGSQIKNVGVVDSYIRGKQYVGGVLGRGYDSKLTGCYNTGIVSGDSKVGGVMGQRQNGNVSDCYNTGAVTGDSDVGGVAGENDTYMYDCYNTGAVSGSSNVGGVVGVNSSTVSNCYNTGDVSGYQYVGGVVGSNLNAQATVSNCYNTSSVAHAGDTYSRGEIGGVVGQNYGKVRACYSLGPVSGTRIIGGVVGKNYAGATVENCYNIGSASTIFKTSNYIGGVVGENAGTVKTSYYLTGCAADGATLQLGIGHATSGSTTADVEGVTAGMTQAQFASGEVAYLLQGSQTSQVWGQDIGTDPAPIFSDAKVYYGYRSCGDTEAGYTNEEATEEKPAHTQQPAYTDNHNGTHSAVYPCCGTTVTEDHTMDTATGKCACDYQFGFYVERDIEIDGLYHETYWFDNLSDALSYAHGSTDYGQYTTQSATVRLHRDLTIEEGETFSFQKQVVLDTNSFSVTNHGTLALEGYTYSTIPAAITGGTVTIGDKTYLWSSENEKWICAEGSHVTELEENKATCAKAAICDLCGTSYGEVDKTKHDSSVECVNGFCPNCDAFEPAVLVDGVYQISNAGNLYWFADKVTNENAVYGSADAILTCDIRVNEGTMTASSTDARVWTPIGKIGLVGDQVVRYPYTGTFEGNGKTVSGLYYHDTSTTLDVGLFSYVGEGGKVQNVGIADSYLCGGHSIGAVVGSNYGSVTGCYNTGTVIISGTAGGVVGYNSNSGTVTGCYNTGTVSGESSAGGVVGGNSGTVTGCYNTGTVSGESDVGGVVGRSIVEIYYNGIVTNCHNTGTVSGTTTVGGVVGYNSGTATNCTNSGTVSGKNDIGGVVGAHSGTVMGCYNTGTVSGEDGVGGVVAYNNGIVMDCYHSGSISGTTYVGGVAGYNSATVTNCYFDSTVYTGDAIGTNEGTATDVEGKSTEQFASGEVAYLLSQGENGSIWGQTIGTDPAPIFSDAKVYYGYTSCGDTEKVYTNNANVFPEKPEHTQNPTYTDNHDGTHSAVYPCCGTTVSPKPHAMDTATGKCVCGLEMAEASVTMGFAGGIAGDGITTYYETLSEAISSVSTATADDKATVTLLKDNDAGQNVNGGVFTLDLNGKTLGGVQAKTALNIYNATVTITDTLGGGEITGQEMGVNAYLGSLTIQEAEITATGESGNGVYAEKATLTVTNAGITATGKYGRGVYAYECPEVTIKGGKITASGTTGRGVDIEACTLTIQDCSVTGSSIGVVAYDGSSVSLENCTVTATEAVCSKNSEIRISGGSVTGSVFDLVGNVKLVLPASGIGTTFPGGITVTNADLVSTLGEGAAYWQGSKMIVPEDGQREITGGDVVVKQACDHQGNTNKTCADNGDGTHSLTCSVCYAAFAEEHTQPLAYVNLEDEGHKAFYPCCQKEDGVAVSGHEYENGYCACLDAQQYTATFMGYSEGLEITNPTPEHGKDYVTQLTGSAPHFTFMWINCGTTQNVPYTFDQQTRTLTIAGTYVDGNVVIAARPYVKVTIEPNGGERDGSSEAFTITPAYKQIPEEIEISRTGYRLAGWNTKADGTGDGYDVDAFVATQDITLYAQWECIHTLGEVEFRDNGDGTHNGYCGECGALLGNYVERPHVYDATTHLCPCGVIETFTVTVYDGNDNIEVSLTNATATYGQDFTAELTSDAEKQPHYEIRYYDVGEDRYDDFTYENGKLTIPAANITGDIEIRVYPYVTVTFHGNGGIFTEPASGTQYDPLVREKDYGETGYLLQESTEYREGYAFAGLNTKPDGTGASYRAVGEYTYTEDLVLYAQWEVNTYTYQVETYTMDAYGNYGEPVTEEKSAAYGTTVNATPNSGAEGFYLDTEHENSLLTATVPANNDLVLKVYIGRNQYPITWDLNGGGTYRNDLPESMYYGVSQLTVFDKFVKEGYTFSHLEDTYGNQYVDGSPNSDCRRFYDVDMPVGGLTLKAIWTVNAYALHAQDQVLDVDYGTNPEDALAGITPEKTGHTHTGWKFYVDEGCTKEYTGTTMPASDLYAQPVFTPIEYNITWILNGCTVNTEIGKELPKTLPYTGNTDTHQLLVALDEPAGYKLEGFRDGNGNELSYSLGNGYLFLPVTGDMIVEAVIKPNSYVATWESADGGSYEKEFKYGETITIPNSEIFQETFRKAGHTLTGWEGYTEGMTMPIDGVTFTAVYAVNPYTITFDSDGGTAVAPITQDYGTAITAPSAPTKDGFHFSTWDPAIPETMPGEDTTLTAIWEAHKDYTYTASGDTITAFCGVCHQVVGTAKLHVTGKTYDATPVTATVTCTMEGVDAPQITYSGNINAGTYTASITLGDATAKADFTITPAVVTVRAEAASKIYGQGDPALNCTIQGLIGADALSGSLSRAAGENAGSYAITVGTLANDNYIIDFIPANLTILPKTITVKADAVSKVYGQADPELTYQAEGLVNGDKLTGELQREAGEDAGAYAITIGTLANSNYAIQFTGDKLTVTKAQQTITLDTGAVSLDCGKTAERTAQAVGAVTYSSSDASIVKVDASGKLTALKPGTVTITVTAAETGNYLPAQAGYTVTVSHKHSTVVTAPTCEDKGYTTYTCPCGDSYVADYTDALGHDYKGKVTLEATCTAEGVMTYTCANDENHTYTEAIPVKAHTPKTAVEENRVEATCTEKGSYEMVTYCGVCGKELGRTQHTIDAIGHDYDDGVITTQPGCETEGVKTYTCANDKNHTYTEKVAPTGHTPKAAVEENRVEATCTEKGSYEMVTYCGVCGKELGRTQHTIDAIGHDYDDGVITTQPGCETEGVKTFTCANDKSHTYTEKVAPTGHSPKAAVEENRVEATCTEKGSHEMVTYCGVCGKELGRTRHEIPVAGHSFGNWTVVKAPTCTVKGQERRDCSACDHYETRLTAALGHNYRDAMDPSCEVCGERRAVYVESIPMFRLYNPTTGEHHYTGSAQERDTLVSLGWNYEGVAWNAPVEFGDPVCRYFNPNTGDHHYTMCGVEGENLIAEGWIYEGVAWNSASSEHLPIYRLYNPNAEIGAHHYTGSAEERDNLVAAGWNYEGIGWYALLY